MSQWKEDGLPEAQIHFLNPVSGAVEDQVAFPNCADELRVQPGGTKAVLSPNQCFVHPILLAPPETPEDEWPDPEEEWDDWEDWPEGDPASIIDLETRSFVGNLPGFGPVAMAPDGATAVAFSRRETLMRQWNTFQQALVGLVIIRMADLYWQVIEYGEDEPDFFFADGGATLYLHDREPGHDRVVRMGSDSLAFTPLAGPATGLDNRAVHADGEHIYAIHEGALRHIESGNEAIEEIPLPFDAVQVFTRPNGDVVVLASDGGRLLVLAAETHAALRDISL